MKSFFYLFFFFIINILHSQSLIFFDDFSDNSNGWLIDDNDYYKTEVKSGFYYIVNKVEEDNVIVGRKIIFDKEQNFSVEVALKQVAGNNNSSYGFFIYGNMHGDGLYFLISSNKKYKIFYSKGGKEEIVRDWKSALNINPRMNYNTLKIMRKKNNLFFYINHKIVEIFRVPPLTGNLTGFVGTGTVKMMADYIKIYGFKPKINLIANPIKQNKENLGTAINTKYSEILPVISPDGKTLYFVRDNNPENIGKNKNHNDIWYSQLTDTGWTKALNIGRPLNNESHNFIFAVSPDNNKLFLNGTYTAFGEPAGNGLSVSFRQKDGSWSIPQKIYIENFYNRADFQSFTITSDQKILIMTLQRDDSRGGLDLYVSFLKQNGRYSEPVNLGDSINTEENEGTPFIASDGKTLYFSSEGHPGYGSADIFVSYRLDDTWQSWSKPKNLGPNINSTGWDAYFSLDAKAEYAYLVSTNNSYGLEDIFRIKLQENAKPDPVVLIYGNIYDKTNLKPLDASVAYIDFDSGEIATNAVSNPKTGEYKIILPYGKKYMIYARKRGYLAISKVIDLTDTAQYKEVQLNIFMIPIREGQAIPLSNIYFKRGTAELIDESYVELDRIFEFLKQNPEITVEIGGHTNNIGDRNQLIRLSYKRANVVRIYLIGKGIDPRRLQVKGYGPDKPISSNDTEAGRKKNQRVEFKIIKTIKK